MLIPSIQTLVLPGDCRTVPNFIKMLEDTDDALRVEAANALKLITGASLQEAVELPEDEMEERNVNDILDTPPEKSDEHEPPRMIEVTRASTSVDSWQHWWQNNRDHFAPDTRWRKGAPFSAAVCLEGLINPHSTLTQRKRAYAELQLAGCRVPFEPDWLVSKQFRALKAMQ